MRFLDPILVAYTLFLAGVLGLVVGSFVNCWAWRYANGESIRGGRSHCTTCGHALGLRDLVPVFSWLASKGRCRYCGQKVSARYPLTELGCCIVFVVLVAVYGISLEAAELMAFSGILLFVSLVDLDRYIIPNGAIVAAIAVRVLYLCGVWALTGAMLPTRFNALLVYDAGIADQLAAFSIDAQLAPDMAALVVDSVIGGVALLVVLLVIVLVADRAFGRSSMGGGDLKLFFVAGLYFGWQQGVFLVVVACVVGIVMALAAPKGALDAHYDDDPAEMPGGVGAATSEPASAESSEQVAVAVESPDDKGKLKRAIPFGPSIAIACVVTMFAGGPFIAWYIGLL